MEKTEELLGPLELDEPPRDGGLERRIVVYGAHRWEKTSWKFFHHGPSEAAFDPRGLSGTRISHERYLDTVQDCYVTWSCCFLQGRRLFSFHTQGLAKIIEDLASTYAGTIAGRWSGLQKREEGYYLPVRKLAEAVPIRENVLYATPDEPHNWGLWLLHVVPAVRFFLEHRGEFGKFMCAAPHAAMRAFLLHLGLHESQVILQDCAKTYHFSRLNVFRQTFRDLFVEGSHHRYFQSLGLDARSRPFSTKRRLYLSRRLWTEATKAYRGLTNELELEQALTRRGFLVIFPEQLTAVQLLRVLSESDVVVGPGGAGMFNTVFMPPGGKVLDLESTTLFLDAHSNIFASCGLEYSLLVGTEDRTDPSPSHRRWSVEPSQVNALLDRFL